MQLTGRTLAMSTAACIVGGAAFGIVTSIATAAQEQAQTTPTTPAPSDLGDEVVSFPLPTASATPTTPTPSFVPLSDPTAPGTAAIAEPTPTLTNSLPTTPSHSDLLSARPTVEPSAAVRTADPASEPVNSSPSARPSSQQTRPTMPASPTPKPTREATVPGAEAAQNAHRETKPRNGWRPPKLQVGNNDITAPRLTSGADVGTSVECGPSLACTVTGNVLFISPDAVSVTVTWSADPAHGYPRWWASTGLSR